VAQYVGQDQKYDVTSNAVLLVDDVENLKEVVDRFSRSQRQIQTVLATRAASGIGELYKRGLIVELQDLTLDETNELNRRLGFPLRPHQVEELFDLLDGHPYLTRAAITAAARGLPVEVATASRFQPIEEELDLLDHELGAEDLRRAWESLLSGVSLDKEAQNALLALGLAKKRKGELVPRNRLYREFFAEPRRDLHTVLISTPDRNLPCARAVRTWLENHNTEVLEFDEFGSPPESYDPHVEHLLNRAELVVGLIAEPFGGRGNLAEIEMAFERYRREGRPKVFAVLVQRGGPPSELLGEIRFSRWDSDADTPILLQELAALLGEDGPSPFEESPGAAE
jgi:AAA-like domain